MPTKSARLHNVENWDDLRFFLALARTGTMAAAAHLGVNYSTVQRRVSEIEERLAVRLFERDGRGFRLTSAGVELMPVASQVENGFFAIDRFLTGRDEQHEGLVRLTTAGGFALDLLPRYLAEFHARYPRISLEVGISKEFKSLARREADVALRVGRGDEADAICKKVGSLAMAPYASRSYLARRGKPETFEDLAEHSVITLDAAQEDSWIGKWITKTFGSEQVIFRSGEFIFQRTACHEGLGVAVLPCFMCDSDTALVRLLPPIPELGAEIWLVTHEDLRSTARVRAVIDFLYDAIRADEAFLTGTSAALDDDARNVG